MTYLEIFLWTYFEFQTAFQEEMSFKGFFYFLAVMAILLSRATPNFAMLVEGVIGINVKLFWIWTNGLAEQSMHFR